MLLFATACGGVVTKPRPKVELWGGVVGVGGTAPIRTSWNGWCERSLFAQGFDAPPPDPHGCRFVDYTVHFECHGPCAQIEGIFAPEVVPLETGHMVVEVELRRHRRRSYTEQVELEVVDPDPGSIVVQCTDLDVVVDCTDPRASHLVVWAAVRSQRYYVHRVVVDGAPTMTGDGIPIDPEGMELAVGAERVQLGEPAAYPVKR